jgi:hypothetical protein
MYRFLPVLAIAGLLFGAAQPASAQAITRGGSVGTNMTVTNPNMAAMSPTPGATSNSSTVSPLPSRPPTFQMAAPSVPEGQIGAAPNQGPVTGYGAGGMRRIPGSPPNRPY